MHHKISVKKDTVGVQGNYVYIITSRRGDVCCTVHMVKLEGDLQRGSGSNYSRNYPNVLCEAFFWIVFDTEENVDKLPWHGSDMPSSALVSFVYI